MPQASGAQSGANKRGAVSDVDVPKVIFLLQTLL